jgi:hypothetical protein
MGDVTAIAPVSLRDGRVRAPLIWHAENKAASNNLLVSAPPQTQFSRR